MLYKKAIIALSFVAVLPIATHVAYAEEFVITSNGSGSSNTIEATSSTTNSVEQSNQANVNNEVNTNTNTGGNQASANTGGDVNIQTGNTQTNTNVENDLNNSTVDSTACCESSDGSITITANGANSTSAVGYTSTTTNTTTVNQNATITNNITGVANTGGNKANNNLGKVNIFTGNIKVNESVKTNVNESFVKVATGGNKAFDIKISGNGADSVNLINLTNLSENIVNVQNNADIFNQSIWTLITGNNEANGNNGDVTIKTGSIEVSVTIENNANHNEVIVDCGCVPTPPPPPPPCTGDGCNPPSNGGNGGNGGGGNGGGGNGGGGSSSGPSSSSPSKDVLPATGMPWMIMLLLGNLLMLLFGMVLRLRSGNSPSIA